MRVARSAAVIGGIISHLVAGVIACQAESLTGRVLLSDADGIVQGDVPGGWVVVCRGNRLLNRQEQRQAKARFELLQAPDGQSFDLVAGAPDMTPTTIHGLAIETGQKLVLNVTLHRIAETLRAPA